jgi:putative heme transporter
VAVVVVIFALVLPKIASYADVWKTISSLTWLEISTLVLTAVFNLFTYWWQMMSALPGLSLGQAAVNNQSSTTIANILPGGGAIAIGLAVAMFRSWGFGGSPIALLISTTGIWNSFLKLGLPIIALVILTLTGHATTALLIPALVGLAILAGCVAAFATMLWKKEFARSIGSALGRAWSRLRGIFHRPPVQDWGDGAVRFRHDTIALVAKRWIPLTATTIVSHLALWFVLLLALRDVGIANNEVSWAQVLAVFAFARLLSAAPITPGGVGLVELALIGGLYAAGRSTTDVPVDVFKAQITAAVLLYRTLTFGLQIPLGGFTYMIWQRKKSWRRPVPMAAEPAVARAATEGGR